MPLLCYPQPPRGGEKQGHNPLFISSAAEQIKILRSPTQIGTHFSAINVLRSTTNPSSGHNTQARFVERSRSTLPPLENVLSEITTSSKTGGSCKGPALLIFYVVAETFLLFAFLFPTDNPGDRCNFLKQCKSNSLCPLAFTYKCTTLKKKVTNVK